MSYYTHPSHVSLSTRSLLGPVACSFIFMLAILTALAQQSRAQECGSGSFEAEAVQNGNTWTVTNGNSTVWTGSSMLEAMREAIGSLSPNRSSKERVVVRGSGSMPANTSLDLPSNTIIDICGTIDVTGSLGGSNAALRGLNVRNVEIQHVRITGSPYFGIFFQRSHDITLGKIVLELSGGHGVRLDNDPSGSGNYGRANRSTNFTIDSIYVSGTNNHGVETYGIENITIGTVTARNTAYSGVLLNATINATIGLVDAEDAGTGTGYAGFRLANRAGKVGDSNTETYNIHVKKVIARRGGRGFFCVSESGGAIIENIEIEDAGGNNSVLIENCYDIKFATVSGTIEGTKEVRLAARSEFDNNRNITVQNLTVTDAPVRENPCGQNIVFSNITLQGNASYDICSEPVSTRKEPNIVASEGLIRRFTSHYDGDRMSLRFQFTDDGYGKPRTSLITLRTTSGKAVYSETVANFGLYSRNIPLKAEGIYVFDVTSGSDRVSRLIVAE